MIIQLGKMSIESLRTDNFISIPWRGDEWTRKHDRDHRAKTTTMSVSTMWDRMKAKFLEFHSQLRPSPAATTTIVASSWSYGNPDASKLCNAPRDQFHHIVLPCICTGSIPCFVLWPLSLLYMYGRVDFSLSCYGTENGSHVRRCIRN